MGGGAKVVEVGRQGYGEEEIRRERGRNLSAGEVRKGNGYKEAGEKTEEEIAGTKMIRYGLMHYHFFFDSSNLRWRWKTIYTKTQNS